MYSVPWLVKVRLHCTEGVQVVVVKLVSHQERYQNCDVTGKIQYDVVKLLVAVDSIGQISMRQTHDPSKFE